MCPNKNKSQKKLESSPSNAQREKSSNPISPPIIRSGPWFQAPVMATLRNPKRGDGTRYGIGEDFLENRGLFVCLDVNTQ